jgi:phage shock protein B
MSPESLAVLLIFGTPFVFVVGGLLIVAWIIWKVSAPRRSEQIQAEEAKLIQELYQGLSHMEERVAVLETLLLDRHRKAGER